jgi:hypothetical protein
MILKNKILIFALSLAILLSVANLVYAKISMPTNTIEVLPSPSPLGIFNIVSTNWNLLEKIAEGKKILADIELKVGSEDISYIEKRISVNDGKIKVTDKKLKDPEKEVALILLNKVTGELDLIKIIKRGGELIAPGNYEIEIVERQNGIRWNYWATEYKVIQPANSMVLLDKWPEKETIKVKKTVTLKNGKKSTVYGNQSKIKYYIYAPYSADYHTSDMVAIGEKYIKDVIDRAYETLKQNKVFSRAYKDILVSDISVLRKDFFTKIPITEHSDFGEFAFDPEKTAERVKIIIAANGSEAYTQTCNSVSACGWVQFTPRTYKEIDKFYSRAGLIDDFQTGAGDHLNSMMAAILLYDYNLAGLIKAHGSQIAQDSRLEEYLAAGYNGSPARVNTSIKASVTNGWTDWLGKLLPETKGYLAKIRFLQKYD